MALTTSTKQIAPDWTGPRINHKEFAAALIARKAALGNNDTMPRNDGSRRTASKRALLAAIRDVGGEW